MKPNRPPRDDLVRALRPGLEIRAADGEDGGMPTLFGHFAVFDEWTEIDSFWEGNFLESIAAGSFRKTMDENSANIRVLFQHGMDPQIGNKVLGRAQVLKEDATGAYYEVPLLDTSYNRDLIPGLEADQYGASFRFRVLKEDFDAKPETSETNPKGLPERTIREVELMEFGPVTFPAYPSATAGVRSLTDTFHIERLLASQRGRRELMEALRSEIESEEEPGEPTPTEDEHDPEPARTTPDTPHILPRHLEWVAARKHEGK